MQVGAFYHGYMCIHIHGHVTAKKVEAEGYRASKQCGGGIAARRCQQEHCRFEAWRCLV